MNVTVQNLTNSPFDLPGGALLPAKGSFTGDLPDAYVTALRASPAVSVSDGDSTSLRDDYIALTGKEPDKRWSEQRIAREIEALLA